MFECVICHFSVEFDDAVAPIASGRCVCLRCFHRETGSIHSMTKELQRDLAEALLGT